MKRQFLFFTFCLMLSACHKDADSLVSVIEIPDAPETLITTRLASITDTLSPDAGQSLQFFDGKDKVFTQSPYAITDGDLVRRDRELIALHARNHTFYKVISLVENDVNYMDWSIPSLHSTNGHSAAELQIDLSGVGTLSIGPNRLTTTDGALYTGSYTVEWMVFDPETTASRFIPSYTARRANGELAQLVPEICLYIALQANDGSELVLKPGSILDQSPFMSTPWYFDAETVAWTINGSETEIEIVESGYYLMGEAVSQVRITGTLHLNNRPAPHYPITILYDGQQRQVYTTNAGQWAILLPRETSCVARVQMPCGVGKEFAFNTGDETTVPLLITDSDVTNTLLRGSVKGCTAEDVEDPLLIVKGAKPQFFFPSETDVAVYYPSCSNDEIDVQAIDQGIMELGPSVRWESGDTIDFRTAFACQAATEEYLYLIVDGDQKLYWDMNSAWTAEDRILIETGSSVSDADFQMFISGAMEGDYEDTRLNILFEDRLLGSRGFSLYCPTATSGCGFTRFTITHFPEASGQWIRGFFQGQFWIKTFHPLTAGYRDVSGEFQVYREF